MDERSMSNEEKLFLEAFFEDISQEPWDSSVLTSPSDLTNQDLEGFLRHASTSQIIRKQMLERVVAHAPIESEAQIPRHIRRSALGRTFFNLDNRLESLRLLLDAPSNRLISIVGSSGSGKTRLALEVVSSTPEKWSSRSTWINCRTMSSERELSRTIACNLSDEPATWLSFSLEALGEAEPILVVLDDFDPDAPYAAIIHSSPHIRFVVISQKSLLDKDAQIIRLDDFSAVEEPNRTFQLFFDTLQSIRSDLQNLGRAFDPIRNLGPRLASLPLGISLAAGCFANTPTSEIEAMAFRLATDTMQASTPTQMDHFVTHLLQSLSTSEFETLQTISLIQGSFSQHQLDSLTTKSSRNILASLVRMSIVQPTNSETEDRFELLETVRNKLDSEPPLHIYDRFTQAYLTVANEIQFLAQHGEWKSGLRTLLENLPNILEATRIAQLIGQDSIVAQMFRTVGRFCFEANLIPEFERLTQYVRTTTSLDSDLELQIQLLGLEGANASMHRSDDECRQLWTHRLTLSRELGNPFYIADTLSDLDTLAFEQGQFEQCLEIANETEQIATDNGLVELVASAIVIQARAYIELADIDTGRARLRRVVELLPLCRNSDLTPFVYQNAVIAFDRLGESDRSRHLLFALLVQASQAERAVLTGWSLMQLGNRYTSQNDLTAAARCYVAASKVYRLSSSRHFIRATNKLKEFREKNGDEWTKDFENVTSDDLIRQVIEDNRD